MARLRYNGVEAALGAALTSSGTAVTFAAALTHSGGTNIATITSGDYLPLSVLDADGKLAEVVHLTAYTSGATTGTITRGREGTTGVAHSSGVDVVHAPTVYDVMSGNALTPADLHATYGDHFTGSSLDAKWTRVGYVSGDEQYQQGGGTFLQVDTARTSGNYYYQTAPAGDFTVVMGGNLIAPSTAMFGPMIWDTTDGGVCATGYSSSDGHYLMKLNASGIYAATGQSVVAPTYQAGFAGVPFWWKLRKVGTSYYATVSLNGRTWRRETAAYTGYTGTPTRIGFGAANGTPVSFAIDFFDVQ